MNVNFAHRNPFVSRVAAAACFAAATFLVSTQAQQEPNDLTELKKQLEALKAEVQTLKEGPPRDVQAENLLKRPFFSGKGLTLGFYGEAKYRFPESGANAFDPHRFVLTPSYQINDWIVFNSELEFEHGGIDEKSGATRSRYNGEIEIEQFYVDMLIHESFNIRSLGIDLVPVGRINKYHEPTVFYSTERPELYSEIIPSTWMEPSIGFFGRIVEGLDYQVQISTGLEDAISGTTELGIAAAGGVRNARPRLRQADENALAYSGRLHYNGITGLDASASFYVTQVRGAAREKSTMALWDVEALYRVPKTGLELRGDFAYWHIGSPENLVVNNNRTGAGALITTDDVGSRMYGWYVEAAYHYWPNAWKEGRGEEMDLVPFVRFSQIVTQSGLNAGSTELDNGTTNRDFITAGLAYFPSPNFVLKADWRHNLNGSAATVRSGANQDYFQLGAGVFF